jgi:hypothetical protein
MRPPGEIRHAVLHAARGFAQQRARDAVPGAVWREVAAQLRPAGIAEHAVRDTWKNLVRSGALQPVGEVRVSGVSRALLACAPAPAHGPAVPDVCAVVRGWASSCIG